jgi:hypothetical protein
MQSSGDLVICLRDDDIDQHDDVGVDTDSGCWYRSAVCAPF